MTQKEARARVKAAGHKLHRDVDWDEWVVSGHGLDYHADRIEDAVDTAEAEARWRDRVRVSRNGC